MVYNDLIRGKTRKIMHIGQYIKRIRESQGGKGYWSKLQVAKRAGISDSYLSEIESGKRKHPSPQILKKLASALKVPEEELLKVAGYLPESYDIEPHQVPVVHEAMASDELAYEVVPLDKREYISFKDCKAVKVTSDSMAPIAYRGQKIIYSETEPIHDGDLVFVKLKNAGPFFKQYFRNRHNKMIVLQSINPTVPYEPLVVKEKDIEWCYKVVGVRF